MKAGLLFPGQGAQFVGMGRDFYDAYGEVRDLYRAARKKLGFDIVELSFNGAAADLALTPIAHPAVALHSISGLFALETRGIRPSAVAGYGLGELAALVAAGYFRPLDAVLAARLRGELLQERCLEQDGKMAVVTGLDAGTVEAGVRRAGSDGVVVVCAYNAPDQYVLSGEAGALGGALDWCRAEGAKQLVTLEVGGAYNSPLMDPCVPTFKHYLEKLGHGKLTAPWVSNVSGRAVEGKDRVADLLSRQLSSPIRWSQSMIEFSSRTGPSVYEVGPGRGLSGLMKRILPGFEVNPLETLADLGAVDFT